METDVQTNNQQLIQLHNDIEDLKEIMYLINERVHNDQEKLDLISSNLETTDSVIEESNINLHEIYTSQKKSYSKKMILIGIGSAMGGAIGGPFGFGIGTKIGIICLSSGILGGGLLGNIVGKM